MEAFGSSTSLTSSRASATSRGLDARISELLVAGSLELSPRELHRAGDVAALLPANTCVYIPSLPGLPLARTLEAVAAIRAAGLVANLVVEVQPDPKPPDSQGKVWKQSPASQTAVDEGSTVTIDANP